MMRDDMTARLAMPLLQPGQAQKETTHNEALTLLDLAVQPSVVAVGTNTPPSAPETGDAWIVGAAPTGAWIGHAGSLAGWTSGGWRFLSPREGMTAWSIADGQVARHGDGRWTVGAVAGNRLVIGGVAVVGMQRPAIANVVGGTLIDDQARIAIEAILNALRGHGLIAR